MHVYIIFLAGLTAIAGEAIDQPHPPSARIIGGSNTNIRTYPFATSVLYSRDLVTYLQYCGGTVLNSRSILSASHCFYDLTSTEYWRVRVGSTNANSGGTVHNIAMFIVHPDYNQRTMDNDIAIVRTTTRIVYVNNAVQPASIAGPNYNLGDNEIVWSIGWGATAIGSAPSEILRHVQVWTVNQQTCRNRYAELGFPVTDNMLCSGWLDVGGRGHCQGDNGGPLLHNGVVVGIASWGYECAQARYPGVNTRVSHYSAWIQANEENSSDFYYKYLT